MAVPGEEGEGVVGARQHVGESWEEPVTCASEDFEGGVRRVVGGAGWHW